jgi:hypothetical protein
VDDDGAQGILSQLPSLTEIKNETTINKHGHNFSYSGIKTRHKGTREQKITTTLTLKL